MHVIIPEMPDICKLRSFPMEKQPFLWHARFFSGIQNLCTSGVYANKKVWHAKCIIDIIVLCGVLPVAVQSNVSDPSYAMYQISV